MTRQEETDETVASSWNSPSKSTMFQLLTVRLALAVVKPCDQFPERCASLAGSSAPMPLVALGTWSGSYKDCAAEDYRCVRSKARDAVPAWIGLGGTHIDTANDYRTQVEVGEAKRICRFSK